MSPANLFPAPFMQNQHEKKLRKRRIGPGGHTPTQITVLQSLVIPNQRQTSISGLLVRSSGGSMAFISTGAYRCQFHSAFLHLLERKL